MKNALAIARLFPPTFKAPTTIPRFANSRQAKQRRLRSVSACNLLLAGGLMTPLAQAQTTAVRVPMCEISGYEVVQVSINGTGPYGFILDTGSSTTLVQRQLLSQLHIPTSDAPPVHMATGVSYPRQDRIPYPSVVRHTDTRLSSEA